MIYAHSLISKSDAKGCPFALYQDRIIKFSFHNMEKSLLPPTLDKQIAKVVISLIIYTLPILQRHELIPGKCHTLADPS